jgi:hypothetical protein
VKACTSYCPKSAESCSALAPPTCGVTMSGESACLQSSVAPPASLVLVVNVPLNAESASGAPGTPGQTLIVTQADIAAGAPMMGNCNRSSQNCCFNMSYPLHSKCVRLAPVETTFGEYVVDPALNLGLGTSPISVPVGATLTPEWAPCVGATCTPQFSQSFPASLLGLPLDAIAAATVPPCSDPPVEPCGAGGLIEWEAYQPTPLSTEAALTYSTSVEPLPPFTMVPPAFDLPGGLGATGFISVTGTDPPFEPTMSSVTPVCVTLPSGAEIEGWSVSFRDLLSQRVLSSISSLQENLTACAENPFGLGASVQTQLPLVANVPTFPPDTPVAVEHLIIAPPSSQRKWLAVLAEPFTGLLESYPTTPLPVTVSGQVKYRGTPISAELHFVSTSIFVTNITGTGCTNPSPPFLFFDTVASTENKNVPGKIGTYSVRLPPGEYDVFVDPAPGSGAARGLATLVTPDAGQTTGGPIALPPLGTCGKIESMENVDLSAATPLEITGTVLLVDGAGGKPLANVTVDLTPSTPFIFSPPQLAINPLASVDVPGSFEVTTDADGVYIFSPPQSLVGPNPNGYDVTVRPQDGTNLPWIVSPQHIPLPNGRTNLGPLFVPAPVSLPLTIHDNVMDNPIVDAVVRAYAFTPCPPPGQCFGRALQIGEALTDSTGSFEMFLAPQPFVAGP